jgi:hypothetical protein
MPYFISVVNVVRCVSDRSGCRSCCFGRCRQAVTSVRGIATNPLNPSSTCNPFSTSLSHALAHTHIHTDTHVRSLTCTADAHCTGELKHRVCLSSRTVINRLPPDTLQWLGGWLSHYLTACSTSPSVLCLLLSIDNIIRYITSLSIG